MRVVRHGDEYWTAQHTCGTCGAELLVESTDIRPNSVVSSRIDMFQCPECRSPQVVGEKDKRFTGKVGAAKGFTMGFGYEQTDPGAYLTDENGHVVWSCDTQPTREQAEAIGRILAGLADD